MKDNNKSLFNWYSFSAYQLFSKHLNYKTLIFYLKEYLTPLKFNFYFHKVKL